MNKSLHFFKRTAVFFCLLFFTFISIARAQKLVQGDIVVIGWDATIDEVRFAALADIPTGTVLKFTDFGWDQTNNAFTASPNADGIITWTLSSRVPKGTVLKFFWGGTGETSVLTNVTAGNVLIPASDLSELRPTTAQDPMNLAGDGVFIYQGSDTNPYFISGFNNSSGTVDANNWNTSIVASARDSQLPNGNGSENALTPGVNAVGMPGGGSQQDVVHYTGETTAADAATWLSRLTDKSKWTGYGSTQSSLINSITIAGPIVNTGSTSSISISGATLNGTANDNGDETTVSFEYGTVSGLSSGVTTVAATTGGSVSAGAGNTSSSVSLTSLSGGTTYYYRIKGVNIKGTSKGEIKSFTTPAIPSVTTVGTLSAFSTCSGTASSAQSFTVSGNNLTTAITVAAPTGYEVSKTSSTTGFNSSVTLTPLSGSVSNATIYVRLKSDASGSPLGNITVSSTGATDKNVAVSGTANFLPTITLGTITSVSTTATSFSLPYTATTGSPNQYSITTGTTAMSDFIAVNNATLGSSPLTVTLPATKTGGTYDFNLILKNSATGCVSSIVPFTLTVNPLSSNADLSGLALSSGSLSPAFDTGTGAYTASVSNAISSITLTPTVSDATATVTIDGTVVTSGSVSESIDLDVGTNTITVLVTAQNGITIKTYTITITRAVPGPNIAVSGTLSAVNTTYGSPSATSTSFTVSGSSLTADITVTPPGGFEVSTSSGSGYGATVTLIPNSGTVNATTVYARLKASATVSGSPYSGNIVVASAGATPQNVATASSTVGAKTLTITGVSISNKQYDGNVTATIGGTAVLSGLLPDDVANVTLGGTPSATFTTAGAGTSKAVTLSGYSISGSASGNYSLTQPIGLTANITAKTISITGNSIADKIYDGNATATISGTAVLNGVLPGDVANVTLGGTPSATFANTSVETGKSVTVSGYSISGSASGNYSLSQPSGLTANITAKLITITGINISNKQYDGNATATISGIAVLNGVLSGDAANVAVGGTSSAMFANASVETGKSVTVSGYSISGSASGNYSLVQPAGLTADITIKTITIAGISINDKIYDGNVTATISGTAALSGVLSGDVANVTLGGTSSAAFTSAGAGIGKAVTVSGYSISGSASGNYSLTQPAGLTANITAKAISITGNGIADKIYDGNATATISGTAALSGVLPGDAASVTLGGTPLATFANASVETGKPVTISGYSISGSASGNYSLTQPAGLTGNITAKSITITGINISNKQYDGNTTATISGTATLNGVLSGDAANVTLGGIPTGTFATAGLGTGKAVIISGYSISGSASGNYNLDQPTGLTANITAKSIAITGINISDKTYDSNTIATISGTATLSGLLPDDVADVTLGGTPSATFTTAGAGTSKAVTVSGYSISGSASGNYSLTQPAGLTANITAKAISITGNGIADKIYDGNATATISGTAALNGVLPGDAASVTLGGTPSATFANTSVEAGKSVTVSGYSISGSASGNYSLSQPSGLTANITAKSITISGINISNKEYDGNATATISGTAALSGVLSGDAANVTLDGIPTGTFATAGLGTGKAV
ncbi:beta strand repeat-containing protein, partial [Pedobacter nyackensis]|uniref:beta strand repeat-containing protein n=1 Tax=Pedobacter nyackensis TaxID=475255 RepID=UPI002931D1F7